MESAKSTDKVVEYRISKIHTTVEFTFANNLDLSNVDYSID